MIIIQQRLFCEHLSVHIILVQVYALPVIALCKFSSFIGSQCCTCILFGLGISYDVTVCIWLGIVYCNRHLV